MLYFEIFESIRKLMLTGILIFCFDGTPTQVVCGLLVCQLSIKAYSFCSPFVEESDDKVAEVVQWQLWFLFLYSLMLFVSTSDDLPNGSAGSSYEVRSSERAVW